MYFDNLDLDYAKFPVKMQFNQEAAVEPRHLTAISTFSYLLIQYLVSTLFKPLKDYDSSEVTYKNYAIFSPISDYYSRGESSETDPGIDIHAYTGSNNTKYVSISFRRPVLLAISKYNNKVFDSGTSLVILPTSESRTLSITNSSNTIYLVTSVSQNSLSNTYFPQQRFLSGGNANVLYYETASLSLTSNLPGTNEKKAVLAEITFGTSIEVKKRFRENIWYIPSAYVPSGDFSNVLSSFEGLEISKVIDYILKYSHLLPGISGYLAFSKGVGMRNPSSGSLGVSFSGSEVTIDSGGVWSEFSLVFGNGIFFTTLDNLYSVAQEENTKIKTLYSGVSTFFDEFTPSLDSATGRVYSLTYRVPEGLYSGESNDEFFVFGLYYNPERHSIILGYIFRETGGDYSVLVENTTNIPNTFVRITDSSSAVEFCTSLLEDSSPQAIDVTETFPSVEEYGGVLVIRGISRGNFFPLFLMKITKRVVGNTTSYTFTGYSLVRKGHISPNSINLFSKEIIPWPENDPNIKLDSIKEFSQYSLTDFIKDLEESTVSTYSEASASSPHPVLGKKLVALNSNNYIDTSLLPEFSPGEATVVYLRKSVENGVTQSYISFNDFIATLKRVLTNLKQNPKIHLVCVPNPDSVSRPDKIYINSSEQTVYLDDLFGGSFGNVKEVKITLGLPIENDTSLTDDTSYCKIIIDSKSKISNLKLTLDSWVFNGAFSSNYQGKPKFYAIELQIGEDNIKPGNNIAQNLEGLELVLCNVDMKYRAAIKFGKRAAYLTPSIVDRDTVSSGKNLLVSPWGSSNSNTNLTLLKGFYIENSKVNLVQEGIVASESDRVKDENVIFGKVEELNSKKYPVILQTGAYIKEKVKFVDSDIHIQFRFPYYPIWESLEGTKLVIPGGFSVSPLFTPVAGRRILFEITGCSIRFSPIPAHDYNGKLSRLTSPDDVPRLFLRYSLFSLKTEHNASVTNSVFFVETHSNGSGNDIQSYRFLTYVLFFIGESTDRSTSIYVKGNLIKTFKRNISNDVSLDSFYGVGNRYYSPVGNYFCLLGRIVSSSDTVSQRGGGTSSDTHKYYTHWYLYMDKNSNFYYGTTTDITDITLTYRPVYYGVLSNNRGSDKFDSKYRLITSFMIYNTFDPVNYDVNSP